MSLKDFFAAIGQVVIYLFVSGTALIGLSTWIGNIIASKIIEKNRFKFQTEIEAIKKEANIALEKVRAFSEKDLFIHRLQFEKEFSIYVELWGKLIELKRATSFLRPIIDYVIEGETEEERKKRRLEEFGKAFTDVNGVFQKSRPFYSEEVYKSVNEIIQIANSEGAQYKFSDSIRFDDYEKAEKHVTLINERIENVCNSIRERIKTVLVME